MPVLVPTCRYIWSSLGADDRTDRAIRNRGFSYE